MSLTHLLLGSNLGDRHGLITKSKELISERVGPIVNQSDIFESEPWGFFSSNWFLNQVVAVQTNLEPHDLLQTILNIETELGRRRRGKGYSSRIIDIDILLIDSLIVESENLTVPHQHLHNRLFALVPLAQLAPDHLLSAHGATISELLERCTDDMEVSPWKGTENDKKGNKGWCRL